MTPKALACAAFAAGLVVSACQPRSVQRPPGMEAVRDTIRMGRVPVEADAARDAPPASPDTPVAPASSVVSASPIVSGSSYRATTAPIALPAVDREFRGVWIATVHNIDWPSRPGLTADQAQRELLRILDNARDLGLNAVIFQIRPAADALYASDIEPWSYFLTGESGRSPQPFWDPLEFAVEQAHARGLELHAWFNPFRAGFTARRAPMAASHVTRRQPGIVRRYGAHHWMDPAEPVARRQALDVISDVVRRYDIDAVHLDDYFYPYQERDSRRRLIRFPDDATWQRYGERTGMTRADWRRSNVDSFIEELYRTVREIKPHVRVGISPFGIWRPGHPPSVRGLDAYAELYADSRKWLANGWVDYFAPQLYWRPYAPQQDYATLLQWWIDQNRHDRHIWPGNIPNNVTGRASGWRASEILDQVRLTRERAGATGNIHFSATGLLRGSDGLGAAFRDSVYARPALVPASPWLSLGHPLPPPVTITDDSARALTTIRFEYATTRPARLIVHAQHGAEWDTRLLIGNTAEFFVEWVRGVPPGTIAVIAVDRAGVEGEPAVFVRCQAC